jgi:hypothetical protein
MKSVLGHGFSTFIPVFFSVCTLNVLWCLKLWYSGYEFLVTSEIFLHNVVYIKFK